jgi:hypothetical protein
VGSDPIEPARGQQRDPGSGDVWRMADAVRTFWFRQIVAAGVFLLVAFVLSWWIPTSWPRGVRALLLMIPLAASVATLVAFRRKDASRGRTTSPS